MRTDERRYPFAAEAVKPDPEDTVPAAQPRATDGPLQDRQLQRDRGLRIPCPPVSHDQPLVSTWRYARKISAELAASCHGPLPGERSVVRSEGGDVNCGPC